MAMKESWKKLYSDKGFSKTKYNLYGRILRSLVDLNGSKNAGFELRALISSAEILFNKGLYDQSNQQIYKARELAAECKITIYQHEAMQWEKQLLMQQAPSQHLYDCHEALKEKQQEIGQKLHIEATLLGLLGKAKSMRQITFNRTALLKNILNDPIFHQPPPTLFARLITSEIRGICSQLKGDFKNAFASFKTVFDLYNDSPTIVFDGSYLNNTLNYVLSAFISNEYIDYGMLGTSMYKIKPAYQDNPVQIDLLIKVLNFLAAFKAQGMQNCEKIAEDIKVFISGNEKAIAPFWLFVLNYSIGLFYFSLAKYSQAISWINKVTYNNKIHPFLTTQYFPRILKLIIHYELGDLDLFDHLYTSTRRLFRKSLKPETFDSNLLKNTRKLYQIYNKEALKVFINDLEKELLNLPKKSFAQKTVEVNILLGWINSKREVKVNQLRGNCWKEEPA